MTTFLLLLSLCVDATCRDRTVYVLDEFTSFNAQDAYRDCLDARNQGRAALAKATAPGTRRLDCKTPAQLERTGL